MAKTESQVNDTNVDGRARGLLLADEPLARQFGEIVDAARALVDEARIQIDLAEMGIRGEAATRRRVGENACRAARIYLNDALYDATHGTAVYNPLGCVVRDLCRATRAVAGVIRRG